MSTAQRQEPQKEVRERILDEATRLFAVQGYNGTSVQAIAIAVGVRKPSVLYHFPSKSALRQEVMDLMLAHWKDELPRVLTAATSGKDRFASAVGAVVRFFVADPNRARLVAREMLDHPEAVRQLLDEHFRPWTSMITDYIRMGQQAGSIQAEVMAEAWVVQVVTMIIASISVGDVTNALVRTEAGDRPDADQLIAEVVRIARRSLFNVRTPHPEPTEGSTHG